MSRYIDADALHDALKAKQKWVVRCGDKHNEGYTYDQVHFAIDDAPSIDIARRKPDEEDYKMWLEKMLIESNPDWVCDGMYDKEITRNWCVDYCGEDDEYITPKCLHMYYHHIERADHKTENSSEKPNNCEPQICDTCRYYNSEIPCGSTPSACKEADKFAEEFVDGLKKLKPKTEPQTIAEDINRRVDMVKKEWEARRIEDEPQTERSE